MKTKFENFNENSLSEKEIQHIRDVRKDTEDPIPDDAKNFSRRSGRIFFDTKFGSKKYMGTWIDDDGFDFDSLKDDDIKITIEENTSYEDFAISVAKILKNDYGQHNFEAFLDKLKEELKHTDINEIKLERIRNLMSPITNYFTILEDEDIDEKTKEKYLDKDSSIKNLDKVVKILHDRGNMTIDDLRKLGYTGK